MAAIYNITQKKGDTFKARTLTFFSDEANTVPIDLSGYSVLMQVRKAGKANTAVLEWTTDPASGEDATITIGGDDNNVITLAQRSGSIMDIDPFNYVYDIQMTSSTGIVSTYIEGQFTITQDVSRNI